MDHSFALSDVESEENNVSIFHHVLLTLLNILSFRFHCMLVSQGHQVIVLHDFCTNEALFEVGVDDSCSLWGLGELTDGPASDLISACGEEVDEVKCIVAGFDDFGNHGALLFILVFKFLAFILCTIGDDLSRDVFINPFFDLFKPFVLLTDEVVLAKINEVDNSLSSDEAMSVENSDFSIAPVAVTNPLILLKQIQHFYQNFLLLTCILGVSTLYDLFHVLQPISHVLQVLKDEF